MLKKTCFSKLLCLLFNLYSSVGSSVNARLKALRGQVAQGCQFGVFWGKFDAQNYIVSNLIVQCLHLIYHLSKADFHFRQQFPHFIK